MIDSFKTIILTIAVVYAVLSYACYAYRRYGNQRILVWNALNCWDFPKFYFARTAVISRAKIAYHARTSGCNARMIQEGLWKAKYTRRHFFRTMLFLDWKKAYPRWVRDKIDDRKWENVGAWGLGGYAIDINRRYVVKPNSQFGWVMDSHGNSYTNRPIQARIKSHWIGP